MYINQIWCILQEGPRGNGEHGQQYQNTDGDGGMEGWMADGVVCNPSRVLNLCPHAMNKEEDHQHQIVCDKP